MPRITPVQGSNSTSPDISSQSKVLLPSWKSSARCNDSAIEFSGFLVEIHPPDTVLDRFVRVRIVFSLFVNAENQKSLGSTANRAEVRCLSACGERNNRIQRNQITYGNRNHRIKFSSLKETLRDRSCAPITRWILFWFTAPFTLFRIEENAVENKQRTGSSCSITRELFENSISVDWNLVSVKVYACNYLLSLLLREYVILKCLKIGKI